MASQWFIMLQGKEAGPFSSRQFKALAAEGKVSPDDLVRQESDTSWVPARRVKGLFAQAAPAAERAGPPTAPSSPAPPRLPAAQPKPPKAAPAAGIQVVADSPTDRVLARHSGSRGKRPWWKSNAVLGMAIVLLIAVPAVGIGMMLSGRGGQEAAPAGPAATPDDSSSQLAGPSEPEPEKRVLTEDEVEQSKKMGLGADGLADLEQLGILGSPDDASKPEKDIETAASEPTSEVDEAQPKEPAEPEAEAMAASDERKAAREEEPEKPPAELDLEDPVDAVTKINADIASLGGGEDDLDYGGGGKSEDKPKNPPAKRGSKKKGDARQKSDGGKGSKDKEG